MDLRHLGIDLVALLTRKSHCRGLELLCAKLDGHLWMGYQIVIPVGVRRLATFGGEDKQAFTIEKGDQWVDALLPAFRACGRQQKQGYTLKGPPTLPPYVRNSSMIC